MAFYIPSLVFSFGLALVAIALYYRSARALRRIEERPSWWESATVLPVVPVLTFDAALAFVVLRAVVNSPL